MENQFIIAVVLVFFVGVFLGSIFGCEGVPQGEYDAFRAVCEQEKAGLQNAVDGEKAKCAGTDAKLSDCTRKLQSSEAIIQGKDSQLASLQKDSQLLSQILSKGNAPEPYRLALSYYEDAFGLGKLPSSQKVKKIEDQVKSLSDPALYSLWRGVMSCEGINGCEDAKSAFTGALDGRIAAAEHNLAVFVEQNANKTG